MFNTVIQETSTTEMPLILAVETSSRIGSAAIALGPKVLAESVFSAPIRHSAEILPAVCALLDECSFTPGQIKHVYISVGPGSFTGLRIATTLAKTMHFANAAKIAAVGTLDVIAANVISLTNEGGCSAPADGAPAWSDGRLAAILDAKRGQFFIAVYSRNPSDMQQPTDQKIWKKVLPDSLMSSSQFLASFASKERPVWLLGDGLVYHSKAFQAEGIHFVDEQYWSPRARNVHLLGWQMALRDGFADPLTLTPNYLRKPDIRAKAR